MILTIAIISGLSFLIKLIKGFIKDDIKLDLYGAAIFSVVTYEACFPLMVIMCVTTGTLFLLHVIIKVINDRK